MGLKSFLQAQGFIAKEDTATEATTVTGNTPTVPMAPVIFPAKTSTDQPSFVQDLPGADVSGTVQQTVEGIDPAFVKFYEDEMTKANMPGPDYYEFRLQMNTMNHKLASKGVTSDLILQTVLASFEAQNIPAAKLAEAARFYKSTLNEKKDTFLKGAAAEKDKQLQLRAAALQSHQSGIDTINRQIQELQSQLQQLEIHLAKEKTQMDVDKTMGKEGIEKIERAERQIALAYTFMAATIDKDITLLQAS